MARKELPMAFEPTPNDALYAPSNLNTASSAGTSHGTSQDYMSAVSLSTPNSVAISSRHSTISTPLHGTLPERSSVLTASELPALNGGATRSPLDQGYWFSLYQDLVEARRRDHDLWARERSGLRHEIDLLKEQLAKIPTSSAASTTSTYTASDKFAFSASMVQHATEKLRQLSVISPPGTRRSSAEPGEEGSSNRRPSSLSRTATTSHLDTIREDLHHEKQVRVASPPFTVSQPSPPTATAQPVLPPASIPLQDTREQTLSVPGQAEDPYSPAPTTSLSPPPESYVKHAGHTPLKTASKRPSFTELDDDSNESKKNTLENLKLLDPANGIFDKDGLDEDPELMGEKILPLTPEGASKKGMMMLNELDSKLAQVADNPDSHVPAAVQIAELMEAHHYQPASALPPANQSHSNQPHSNQPHSNQPHSNSNNSNGSNGASTADDRAKGIPLRVKRSTNFGAPLGEISPT